MLCVDLRTKTTWNHGFGTVEYQKKLTPII